MQITYSILSGRYLDGSLPQIGACPAGVQVASVCFQSRCPSLCPIPLRRGRCNAPFSLLLTQTVSFVLLWQHLSPLISLLCCLLVTPLAVTQLEVGYHILHSVRISSLCYLPGLFSSRLHRNIPFLSQISSSLFLILLEGSLWGSTSSQDRCPCGWSSWLQLTQPGVDTCSRAVNNTSVQQGCYQ